MRSKYEWGYGFNEHNIIAGKDDAKFAVGNQWDPVVEARRKAANKPILTFNRLIAFVAQIVGNRLMNETEIRVHPDKAGTKEIAEVREGLIRSIFRIRTPISPVMKPRNTSASAAKVISHSRSITRTTMFSSRKSSFRPLPTLTRWC